MLETGASVEINRPVGQVFGYVSDVKNDPKWHTDLLEVKQETEGPVGAGSRFHIRFKPFMGSSEGTVSIGGHDLDRRLELIGDMGRLKPRITYLFESSGAGTKVTRTVHLQLPGLMRLFQPLMKRPFRKRQELFLANLKRVMEQ